VWLSNGMLFGLPTARPAGTLNGPASLITNSKTLPLAIPISFFDQIFFRFGIRVDDGDYPSFS